ncbi:MAG TPA: YbhB/YbcL family Raf kinase inhibitor-like protein, partial [Anaerolineales bacterium]|nr:YbhB/YbcL family Raf kinase inhibitor-like protein [Anaerolineales bacterium]
MKRIVFYLLPVIMLISACAPAATETPNQPVTDPLAMEDAMSIDLTSTAFAQGQAIPEKYTCVGDAASSLKDVSPPLTWGEPPADTQSFALIMDDPDAPIGTWDHWILFNIPASTRNLPESMPVNSGFPGGNNSWGRTGYGGPCPPSGTHRYFFRLYALDEMLA